ncbi:hypothetical protein KIW84_032970 [Lathyrus oleraceus]|uniref:Ubiquitin carboxyl-terminal hydrolase 7 ICP0-binding domain-containing protein n=1 Tax=Pisum sativum TaxID=3888 RepID=A0A9D5B2K4_PEA|nr:hypothetical protein KIW84_032970 [Pisum sativum]
MHERMKKEHKNEEMFETHNYTIIKVVQDEDLEKQVGNNICFDLVAPDKVKTFHVSKVTTFNHFKKKLATVFGIPAQFQRFWIGQLTVGNHENFDLENEDKLTFFLEVERGRDLCPVALLNLEKDDILLFFKLYDFEKETLRYVGRLFVKSRGKPSDILARLNEMAGFDSEQEIELYEEIRFKPNVMCEPVDKKLTFKASELENGDIICFQKSLAMDCKKRFPFPDVTSYLKFVHIYEIPYSSFSQRIGRLKIMEEQNKIIIAEEANVHRNTAAQRSEVDIETTKDESSSKRNNSEFIVDSEEVDALIEDDVIDVIDKVLSEEISISLRSQHSVLGLEARKLDPNLPQQLLQELRDIAFKDDLVENLKKGFTRKVNFNSIKERIDANADVFSSWQLEHVNVIVNLLNKVVTMFDKLENLKKERNTAEKCTEEDNQELKRKRQKILVSKASFTNHQTELKSLDVQIADLKGKLEKLQGDRVKMVEMQDQEKDKITSFNKEVKSIIYRLADEKMKLKSVECNILEAQTELESHEKMYKTFRTSPPF